MAKKEKIAGRMGEGAWRSQIIWDDKRSIEGIRGQIPNTIEDRSASL